MREHLLKSLSLASISKLSFVRWYFVKVSCRGLVMLWVLSKKFCYRQKTEIRAKKLLQT